MKTLKYILISLIAISIMKKARAQQDQNIAIYMKQTAIIPDKKFRVKKGHKTIGDYVPDKKIVHTVNGQPLFVSVIEEKQGNYIQTGFDADKLVLTHPNSLEILEKIGTIQHPRIVPERPSKSILYGVRLQQPIIHT